MAKQSSRRSARPARSSLRLMAPLPGATASRLRFQKGRNVAELVADRRSVDPPKRAAYVQPTFALQNLHTASPDGSVDALIHPRPWDCWHLCQIDNPGNATHSTTAMPASASCPCWEQTEQHFEQNVPATYMRMCVSIRPSPHFEQGASGRMERRQAACRGGRFMISAPGVTDGTGCPI